LRIDSHQHFWKYNSVRDSWITDDMKVIQRDFLPADLHPQLKEHHIEGCVAVQADQSEGETQFLLTQANQHEFIKGVVGWVNLKSDKIREQLSSYSKHPKLKGFRHVVQAEPDGFLMQKDFVRGINALTEFNFTYDILIYARQLEEAFWLVKQFPNQKFVVDHIAKPSIRERESKQWMKNMSTISTFENVLCKISGMVTEADWKNWRKEDFTPYLDHVLGAFGSGRLMYGSDWPVCQVAASYTQQLGIVEDYIATLSPSEKESIMGGNAIRFYNL
jgi:L-fuconolactonase